MTHTEDRPPLDNLPIVELFRIAKAEGVPISRKLRRKPQVIAALVEAGIDEAPTDPGGGADSPVETPGAGGSAGSTPAGTSAPPPATPPAFVEPDQSLTARPGEAVARKPFTPQTAPPPASAAPGSDTSPDPAPTAGEVSEPPEMPEGLGPSRNHPAVPYLQELLRDAGFMPVKDDNGTRYGPKVQAAVARLNNAHPECKSRPRARRDVTLTPAGWAKLHELVNG